MPELSTASVLIVTLVTCAGVALYLTYWWSRGHERTGCDAACDSVGYVVNGLNEVLAAGTTVSVFSIPASLSSMTATVARRSNSTIELITSSEPAGTLTEVGRPIRLVLTRNDEALEAIAPVLDYRKFEGVATLFVARPEWLARLRRRSSMRGRIGSFISVTPAGAFTSGAVEFRGLLSDLSSGGCSISLPERVSPGAALRIHLPFQDLRTERIVARVLTCDRLVPGGDFPFRARCKFIELSELTHTQLIAALEALSKASE